jgi:hypothetical protein
MNINTTKAAVQEGGDANARLGKRLRASEEEAQLLRERLAAKPPPALPPAPPPQVAAAPLPPPRKETKDMASSTDREDSSSSSKAAEAELSQAASQSRDKCLVLEKQLRSVSVNRKWQTTALLLALWAAILALLLGAAMEFRPCTHDDFRITS